jgi:hypothetical protein
MVRRRLLRSGMVFILLFTIIFFVSNVSQIAEAEIQNPKYQNGVVLERTYKSSIDGAPLPCTIYGPTNPPAGGRLPVWVDLHAFGGYGGIPQDWFLNYPAWANLYGMMIISPWGRDQKGLYTDGLESTDPEEREPSIFDDFQGGSDGWTYDEDWELGSESTAGWLVETDDDAALR